MWDNGLYISPRFTRDHYKRLNLRLESSERDWLTAIEIFVDRINRRFFEVIEELLGKIIRNREQFIGFSFSVMALDCLLIETLQQFKLGVNETPSPNRNAFISLLTLSKHFREHFNRETARIFYEDIRCGILHQAQTKKNTQLTYDCPNMVQSIRNGIRVDVELFSIALLNEFRDYINFLMDRNNTEPRINFIKKMNFIVAS